MSTTVAQVILEGRTAVNDGYGDHLITDDVSSQANGTNKVFQLNNQNIVQTVDGSPANLIAYVNNAAVTVTVTSEEGGIVTFAAAPAAGALIQCLYYWFMLSDAQWITLLQSAERFVSGVDPLISTVASLMDVADNLILPVETYAEYLACTKMASLAHWFYNSEAGGKTFDKASISERWLNQAKDLLKEAEGSREDPYRRYDQSKAPAYAVQNLAGVRYWEPPR